MSTTVSYKGSTLTTVNNQTRTLHTAGKWLEGDITLVDTTTSQAISISDVSNSTGTTAVITGTVPSYGTKTISQNGTYNASTDGYDGYSSVTVNVSGGSGGGGTPSQTQHTIYFEFADTTNTTITGYWDDSFISSAITATTPSTYNNKTVTLARLDGVAWYEPMNIPIGVQLIDYTKATDDYAITTASGDIEAAEWLCVTDYTLIDPTMTFSYAGCYWYYIAFYNSSKTYISTISIQNDCTNSDASSTNIGTGTLTPAKIPANAMYVRITGFRDPNSNNTSLIRTA